MVLLRLEFLATQVLEGTIIEDKKKVLLMDILQENQLGKQEEPVAQATHKFYNLVIKSLQTSKQLEDNRLLLFCSKMYIPNIVDLHQYVVVLYYDLKRTNIQIDEKSQNQSFRIIGGSRYLSILATISAYITFACILSQHNIFLSENCICYQYLISNGKLLV